MSESNQICIFLDLVTNFFPNNVPVFDIQINILARIDHSFITYTLFPTLGSRILYCLDFFSFY